MLTILQSIKGLRQEGGHQNYEINSLKLVILNMIKFDYVCVDRALLLVFFKNLNHCNVRLKKNLKPSIVKSRGPICLADHPFVPQDFF